MTKNRSLAYLALLLNVLIWGAALPIVKPSLDHITPFNFLFLRYLIAVPIMIPVLLFHLKKIKLKSIKLSKIFLLELLGSPIPLTLLYIGLTKTSAIEASLLGATSPLFITLGGIIFLKEKEEKREWIGLLVSFIGTILLTLEPFLSGSFQSATFSIEGNLLIILNNIAWTAYLLIAKRFYKNTPKAFVSSISMIVALITFFFVNLLTNQLPSFSVLQIPEVARAVFYMGILGSPIAFTLYIFGQNLIEASEASLFNYLAGPIAIPFAYLLLRETPTLTQILSIAIIFSGVFIAEYRVKKSR